MLGNCERVIDQSNRRRPVCSLRHGICACGRSGSRLLELTEWRAKPAVHFGGKSRIIDFALSNALNSGIRRIGVATQYKAHSLIRHLQRGWNFFRAERNESFDILPASQRVSDGAWYAGTADAVYQNIDIIESYAPRYVVILAGDHVYKMDYEPMLRSARRAESRRDHRLPRSPASMRRPRSASWHVDDGDQIVSFVEKPERPADHARQSRHGACEHGHLRVRHCVPVRAASPRRCRPGLEP